MSSDPTTDRSKLSPVLPDPDPHGQAALLLAESTLHMLVERGLLTNADAITAVRVATDVKEEIVELANESPRASEASLRLLARITGSFETSSNPPPSAACPASVRGGFHISPELHRSDGLVCGVGAHPWCLPR